MGWAGKVLTLGFWWKQKLAGAVHGRHRHLAAPRRVRGGGQYGG